MTSDRRERRPIMAVLIDAKNTLFTPKDMSRPQHLARIYHQVTGRWVNETMLWVQSRAVRREIDQELVSVGLENIFNTPPYWVKVNQETAKSVGLSITPEQAMSVHAHIVEGTDLYTVTRERREFLEWLRYDKFRSHRVTLVTASNSSRGALERLLSAHRVRPCFNGAYSPDVVGSSKPAGDFFREVLHSLGAESVEALMIGNSLFTDAGARKVGINTVILLDRHEPMHTFAVREYQQLDDPNQPLFFSTTRLARLQRYIDEHFVAK